MLPDLIKTKRKLQRVHIEYVQKTAYAALGVLSVAPRHQVQEGEMMRVIRSDGSVEDSTPMRASGEMEIDLKSIGTMTAEQRLDHLNDLAEKLAASMAAGLYSSLNQALDAAGQTVQAKGKPKVEAVLEMLEKISMEFDDTGAVKKLYLGGDEDGAKAIRAALTQIRADPQLRERYSDLMTRKMEAWRDREASRKLAG